MMTWTDRQWRWGEESNSADILRGESRGFAHRSDVGGERKRGVKPSSRLFLT